MIITHQPGPIFNKGAAMNMAYHEVRRLFNPDCYVFHDVDMLPEDDRNIYRCGPNPIHLGVHIDKYKYK